MNNLDLRNTQRFNTRFSRLLLFAIPVLLMLGQRTYAQVPVLYGTSAEGGSDSLGCIYKINGDGSGFDTLYSFKKATGFEPLVMHMANHNGKLYGTTSAGGQNGKGVIFSFDLSTNSYTDILDFDSANGGGPYGGLTLLNGMFYGVTSIGGANNAGLLYSFNPTNNAFADLVDFDGVNKGAAPYGELVAVNGTLYGGTVEGGVNGEGVIFTFSPGSGFQKLIDLDTTTGEEIPYGYSMVDGGNGFIYGVTYEGGANSLGTIFTLNKTNNAFQKIFDFDSTTGFNPANGMVLAANGLLYGIAGYGGANDVGTFYSINPQNNNAFTKIHDFNSLNDGTYPISSLLKASDNNLYGTTEVGGANGDGALFSYNPTTSQFAKFHDCTVLDLAPFGSLMEPSLSEGIPSINRQQLITVSPNPVADAAVVHFLTVGENEYNLTVTDITGKVLMVKENFIATGTQNMTIELGNFSAGMYFFNVTGNGQSLQTLKVVKE